MFISQIIQSYKKLSCRDASCTASTYLQRSFLLPIMTASDLLVHKILLWLGYPMVKNFHHRVALWQSRKTLHQWKDGLTTTHTNNRFIRCFYVCISIQNILKGNIQPKFKGASVWPKSTAVITGVIFTCPGRAGPGRAGPVFRLDRRLTYFARLALRAAQHAVEPESRFTDGRTLDTSLKLTTSVTKLAWEGNREYSPRPRNRGIIRIVTNMYYLGKGITDTMPPKGYWPVCSCNGIV